MRGVQSPECADDAARQEQHGEAEHESAPTAANPFTTNVTSLSKVTGAARGPPVLRTNTTRPGAECVRAVTVLFVGAGTRGP
jgi:hypothetical protein